MIEIVGASDAIQLDGDDGVKLLKGTDGRFAPAFDLGERESVAREGALLQRVRAQPRDVSLPLLVYGDVRVNWRRLLSLLNPLKADVRLRWSYPDGSTRTLRGRVSGVSSREDAASAGTSWLRVDATLRCHDPFWLSDLESLTFDLSPGEWFPMPPYAISSGVLAGKLNVNNDGDAPAWPVWQIIGPCGPFTASSGAETLLFDSPLAAEETITIDTRPGRKTVVDGDGANRYPDLDDGASLWAIPPGTSTVDIEIPDATDDTRLLVSWQRRHLTP